MRLDGIRDFTQETFVTDLENIVSRLKKRENNCYWKDKEYRVFENVPLLL